MTSGIRIGLLRRFLTDDLHAAINYPACQFQIRELLWMENAPSHFRFKTLPHSFCFNQKNILNQKYFIILILIYYNYFNIGNARNLINTGYIFIAWFFFKYKDTFAYTIQTIQKIVNNIFGKYFSNSRHDFSNDTFALFSQSRWWWSVRKGSYAYQCDFLLFVWALSIK